VDFFLLLLRGEQTGELPHLQRVRRLAERVGGLGQPERRAEQIAQPPGPLRELESLKNRNAAPVGCSG
jgi:hypothetical protein